MSIASRITSIEGHIEDDYKALTRLGADLTNVDKNIENIADVVDTIYDTLPKVSDTGSTLSLSPTLKGGLSTIPLGNCEQDTYTGKNLCEISNDTFTSYGNIVVTKNDNIVNINGNKDNVDGQGSKAFTLNGISLGNYASYLNASKVIHLTAGTYTLSANSVNGSYSNINQVRIGLFKKNTSTPHTEKIYINILESLSAASTIEEGDYYLAVAYIYTSGTNISFNNFSFKVQLESGSSVTSWEPYVRWNTKS